MKLYDSLWSYASINELLNVIIASICSSILYCILCLLIPVHPPISTIFLYLLLLLVFVGGSRFGYRFVRLYASRHYLFGRSDDNESKVMIVGAGSAGEKILRETLVSTKLHKKLFVSLMMMQQNTIDAFTMFLLQGEEMKSLHKLKNIKLMKSM